MKLIIFKNKLGDVFRIGLYDENDKWIKWISKKSVGIYYNEVDIVETRII